MKKKIFYIILAVLFIAIVIFLQDSDEFNWLRAKLGNKSTDYAQYIKRNPDGWHIAEAQDRFDQRCWSEALEGGFLADFQNYITQNPDGKYINDANENIQRILWSQLISKNSIEDYQQFIQQYPDSQYLEQAINNIEMLQWEKIEAEGNIEDVKKFIEDYSDSETINEVNDRIEHLIWNDAESQNKRENYEWYLSLYPSGLYANQARSRLEQLFELWPVYIDSYHLYDLTDYDNNYRDIFIKNITAILSEIETIEIVSEKEDAIVHLQIGYSLSFRDGHSEDDNILKFIENRLRDRALINQQAKLATFDIALHIYLWDIENDCLLAFSSSSIPPEPGNATPARTIGRDRFLDEQVRMLVENSIIPEFVYLVEGKDGVMNMQGENQYFFFRNDMGKPQQRVSVKIENGPISTYHWRDPSLERYIYYQLQQSEMDIVRTYDDQSYQLLVIWSKYSRSRQVDRNSPLRAYGLWAHFVIYKKDNEQKNYQVFEKGILSDTPHAQYGLLPVEVIGQWRKSFDNSSVIGEIVKTLQNPLQVNNQQADVDI